MFIDKTFTAPILDERKHGFYESVTLPNTVGFAKFDVFKAANICRHAIK